METCIQYSISAFVFLVIVKIVWNALNAMIMTISRTVVLGVPIGDLVPLLCGIVILAFLLYIAVGIVLNILYVVEIWIDRAPRIGKRRLIETAQGPIQLLPNGRWSFVQQPAVEVIAPNVPALNDRIIPINQYRAAKSDYRAAWRRTAGAFLQLAAENGLARSALRRVGVTQPQYEYITNKLLEIGVLVLRNERNPRAGYRFFRRDGHELSVAELLALPTWENADFESPPPADFVVAGGDLRD
jgi:hypothetical protein